MSFGDIQTSDYDSNQDSTVNNISQTDYANFSDSENRISENKDYSQSKNIINNDILEKLDIVRKNDNQNIQDKLSQDTLGNDNSLNNNNKIDKSQVKKLLGNVFSKDFEKIQHLIKKGLIDSEQGQNLKQQVIKKAFDKVLQNEKIKQKLTEKMKLNTSKQNSIYDLNRTNPNFFSSNSRKEVLKYLKSGNIKLNNQELNKVSNMIRGIEYSAIERYLQKAVHDKNLKTANESAKQRLTANAQMANFSNNFSRIFTREQIGKMNTKQFMKFEPIIMEQLKKGMIK